MVETDAIFFFTVIFFLFDEVIIILSLTGVITKIQKNMKFKYWYYSSFFDWLGVA